MESSRLRAELARVTTERDSARCRRYALARLNQPNRLLFEHPEYRYVLRGFGYSCLGILEPHDGFEHPFVRLSSVGTLVISHFYALLTWLCPVVLWFHPTLPSGSKPLGQQFVGSKTVFCSRRNTNPGLNGGRTQSAFTALSTFLLVEILSSEFFRYGIRLRCTIMIDSRSAHFDVNRGQIHNGEIEDVAFNGALQFVASCCVHTGLGSEPLPNPGNPGFRRQTIL
jgi:hypothetical protein